MSQRTASVRNSPNRSLDNERIDEIGDDDPLEELQLTDNDALDDLESRDILPEPSIASPLASPTIDHTTLQLPAGNLEHDTEKIGQSQRPEHPETNERDVERYLKELDWAELQSRFEQEMVNKCQDEHDILQLMHRLTRYHAIWGQASASQEQGRAAKRLRTRITYVQNKEEELENKRAHHMNVVQAFENALQLLRGTR